MTKKQRGRRVLKANSAALDRSVRRVVGKTKAEARRVREKKQVLVDRELDIIRKEETLTPDAILRRARDKTHPLHKFFEWDDSKAAASWRREQAYQMIRASVQVAQIIEARSVVPSVATESVEVRRLVAPFRRGEGYQLRETALEKVDTRAVMIERKYSELRSWCRSVIDIHEFDALRQMIEKHLP